MFVSLRQWRAFALAVTSVLILTACGGTGGSAAEASLNQADVAFLQGMVPHHSQAVRMAQMVPDHTDRPELNELADTIIQTQTEEVDTMNGLLTDAGEEPVPAEMADMEGMADMDHGGMEMSGMMDAGQMDRLMNARGEEFDVLFLQMMTEHHQGAIDAAEQVLEEGESPQVAELAQEIIDAQRAEIEQMAAWQQEWSA